MIEESRISPGSVHAEAEEQSQQQVLGYNAATEKGEDGQQHHQPNEQSFPRTVQQQYKGAHHWSGNQSGQDGISNRK